MNWRQPWIAAERKRRTRIIVRRKPTEGKTAFAGVIPEPPFAGFRPSVVVFNVERAPSRPFARCDFQRDHRLAGGSWGKRGEARKLRGRTSVQYT